MSQEVKAFKLVSGEEIISRIKEEDENTITIEKPSMVGVGQAPDGSGLMVQLMPWLASNQDGEAVLYKRNIVAEIKPHEALEKGYLEKTSGIALATG